jgi:hypothetical protein
MVQQVLAPHPVAAQGHALRTSGDGAPARIRTCRGSGGRSISTPLPRPFSPSSLPKDDIHVTFFSTLTSLGVPYRVECFFPADKGSEALMRRLARKARGESSVG